jgi:hypothetical protein
VQYYEWFVVAAFGFRVAPPSVMVILTILRSEPVGLLTLGIGFIALALFLRKKVTESTRLASNSSGNN